MNARKKLNTFYVHTSIGAAAVAGILFQSWLVFLITAMIIIGFALQDGSIRPSPIKKRGRRNRRR